MQNRLQSPWSTKGRILFHFRKVLRWEFWDRKQTKERIQTQKPQKRTDNRQNQLQQTLPETGFGDDDRPRRDEQTKPIAITSVPNWFWDRKQTKLCQDRPKIGGGKGADFPPDKRSMKAKGQTIGRGADKTDMGK